MPRSAILLGAIVLASLAASACFTDTHVRGLSTSEAQASRVVRAPTKLHLIDGGLIVAPNGFEVASGEDGAEVWLRGRGAYGELTQGRQRAGSSDLSHGSYPGMRYDLTRETRWGVERVALDSVAAVEYYVQNVDLAATAATLPLTAIAAAGLAVAIFGSCPTLYTIGDDGPTLEAEAFSYSIARRFEMDDLDRLDGGRVGEDGRFTLLLRNEALETHYINRLSLLLVDHPLGYTAFPTPRQGVVLFGAEAPLAKATSRDGRDFRRDLVARDDRHFRSDSAVVASLSEGVNRDWIEIEVDVPEGVSEAVLAIRLRNTLLNTVLLYDVMLAGQGASAAEWMGRELDRPLTAWRLARWYREHFGLHVQQHDGRGFREVARFGDTGPIAWHEAATSLRVRSGERLRLRLDFLPDNWMIDWVGVSFDTGGDLRTSSLAPSTVVGTGRSAPADFKERVARRDDAYMVTFPGDEYTLTFDVPHVGEGRTLSLFAATRGYYVEWLRPDWLMPEDGGRPFRPDDESIIAAAQLWSQKREAFEQAFFSSHIPVYVP